jgi:23S rRNA (cytidine1920-2'-O)/16S rRNA (cytidine1409-2'-O)-methyltransferase
VSGLCHDIDVTSQAAVRARMRLDQLLVERGLAESTKRAQALLLAGRVRVGSGGSARGDRKSGDLVDPSVAVEVTVSEPYVSRGGHKLAAALDGFGLDPRGRVCLDVGASTGGFTDVLLQRGAARVYAIDVGRAQLAERLLADSRLVALDRLNARTLNARTLPEPIELATIDVSFISLGLVLGPVASTFGPAGGDLVALVKPQFEAGRRDVRHGVVREPGVHLRVLERAIGAARDADLRPLDVLSSPLVGPQGNREFLLHLAVGPFGAPEPGDFGQRLERVAAGGIP